jgi:hypothetical protein
MKSPNRSPELQRNCNGATRTWRACVCWANNPTECLPKHSASNSQAMTKIGRPRIIESPVEMERLVEEYVRAIMSRLTSHADRRRVRSQQWRFCSRYRLLCETV